MKKLFALTSLMLGIGLASAQETYSTWGQHKTLFLNAATAGVSATSTINNFPILVRLDTTNFKTGFAQALGKGQDIRFTKNGDVIRLAHQIDTWDSTKKVASIWVLVDTIKGGINNQSIRMHWGKAGAADSSNGKVVFDTANGFEAVFHMNKGDTTGEVDATANAFTANEFNGPVDTTGDIGRSRFFNGTNQRFQIPNSASSALNMQLTDSYTLSAWMNPTAVSQTANDGNKIIDKGDNQYVLAIYDNATPKYWEITTRGNNAYNQATSNASFTETGFTGYKTIVGEDAIGAWHHLVGTFQGAAVGNAIAESLYYDGSLVSVWAGTNTNNTGRTLTFNVNFGVQAAGTAPNGTTFTRFWNGALDEIRISKRSRSYDWNKMEYANQKAAQTFVTLDSASPLPRVPGAPTGVTAKVGSPTNLDTVSWVAPTDHGTAAITGYTVTSIPGGLTCTAAVSPCVVTGLSSGTAYTFTATATNSVGPSAASSPSIPIVTGIGSFYNDKGVHLSGNSMMLKLPEFSGTAQITATDVWGRVVWNQTVQSGVREVSWKKNFSQGVAPGLYIVRMMVQDASHKPQLLVESKIMITP